MTEAWNPHKRRNANNIHNSFTLPTNEFLLCAFAAFEAGSHSGGAIANDLSGIWAWHILNGVPYQGGTRLAYTIHFLFLLCFPHRGAHCATPSDSKQPACPPVTIDMLILLHSHLSLADPLNAACLAAADCTTWGQARLAKFSPHHFPTVANLHPISTTGRSCMLFLPWSKTVHDHGEDLFLGHQHAPSDPIASLNNHLSVNPLRPSSHLFAYQSPSGALVPLTKRKFLSRCNDVWSQHGHPVISGHSFHIGGTTELLLCSVPPHIVKTLGCWSSDAFLHYWCCLEHLAPLHAELLSPHLSSIPQP
ncbi:hypothetical protein DFJ58DRAFT_712984 [Suillus subalutaceus]|uniref:uncharacterized protein n=1 Tax=Suillus subalutaceus TaxID=48586 RepID=UPI001B87CB9E|nr:uncharacterized protein DFJ58DRAFT_712984 [Suillus subalutaceus]KAG1875516.1 hypothetical protein DFJ58DRAFT_712984 [Suillus subalutaceus]